MEAFYETCAHCDGLFYQGFLEACKECDDRICPGCGEFSAQTYCMNCLDED